MTSTEKATERLQVLARQVTAGNATTRLAVCPKEMKDFLVHDNKELREAIYEFLKDDLYRPNHYQGLMEFREQTLQRLKKFVAQKFFSVRDYTNEPRRFMAALESLMYADYSLAIKAGVHFTLCGGTIAKLGTAYHHNKYLPGMDDLTLPGCFGMTELGHGSNVMGIETTAVYDKASGQFIINTPNDEASKYWIGGSGQHGKICAVFAQLTVNGQWQGPHVFVVRIRDDQGRLMPGVRIADQGPKMGLNGVDNGRIWFDNVRVPREDMLDAFASVSPDGTYSSSIPSVSQRFGTVVGGLTTGRVLIATGGVDGVKLALTVAIRYSCSRTQFGDRPIMDYVTHQARLLPPLAQTYALHLALGHLKTLTAARRPADAKAIHVLSSGLKAAATWGRVEAMQDCRECCGGMGFLSSNKIGPMMTDMNVDVTFEGDNTVMMQQVTRALLEDKAALSRGAPAVPSAGALAAGGTSCSKTLQSLLAYREGALLAQVAGEMAAAATRADGPAAKAAASAAAFDRQLDVVVSIGWAWVERFCHANFLQEVNRAPESLRTALDLLAQLYALSRIQRSLDFYLTVGALNRADVVALRNATMDIYAQLTAGGSRCAAVALCDAFGIPDHLLQAPIAFDWRKV
ncbi:hypothetical protein VOLCADRAFT_104659 [Volvox carteri f. nagariensis]|uniref:Acyl-coenzyme A oxidase n=1 Tax=Volvox carteri f. nagariensis TaxID=3068 RepID=D8TVM2_VOLCA|nr:uncharacterized protein VOLCADRAFT_104659 [Volvox carteri f. nagariensis]EFJ48478.1 hypothetical protein VOLCADRAFT_104659 [Volvox carteri f. nagariensis]|eukprot:XP_002950277.1 hypothetical protein VOLCADRAFT_104659 [Volvox carteri f. nagariensis]